MTALLAALLALQAGSVPAPAAPAVNEDIVIIGQRLTKLKAKVSTDRQGRLRCRIKRSSGDSGLDAAFCGIAQRCVEANPASAAVLEACMTHRKDEMIAALAASRARARSLQGKNDASN